MQRIVNFSLNGEPVKVIVDPHETLLDLLRNKLNKTGTKKGCNEGDCGACTVIINRRAVNACLVLAFEIEGFDVTTIEGLSADGKLHPLQEAFMQFGGLQCGFCTPGMIMSAKAFLDENPNPSEEEIRKAISGNICRCTGYVKIVQAISEASKVIAGGKACITTV